MSNKTVDLLLTESVDSLGIVGDVVKVKAGYARNYLIPHGCAVLPTDRAKEQLAERRAKVQAELAQLRKDLETTIEKLDGFEITLTQSCNDHGFLYGSVTQHDIAAALNEVGFPQISDRHVRLGMSIKRIDSYSVPVQFDADLKAEIKVWVVADRELVFADEGADKEGAEGDDDGDDRRERKMDGGGVDALGDNE